MAHAQKQQQEGILFMIKNSKKLFMGLCVAAVVGLFSAGVRAEDKGGIAPGTMDFLASTTISGYVDTSFEWQINPDR